METNVIWRNARAAVIELDDGGYFTCADTWEIFVNDEPAGTTNTVETYVDGLTPGKRNLIRFVCGERELSVGVTTPAEPFTINVRDCGAKGDAEHDDTTNIQAAIMACPKGGRVLIPAGNYRIKSLFLKSNINIELAEGAVLLARHDRAALAYIPGTVTGDEGGWVRRHRYAAPGPLGGRELLDLLFDLYGPERARRVHLWPRRHRRPDRFC